jgi:L-amino acid N-acyltransferase YncA
MTLPHLLRLATPADGDAIAAIYAPYVTETAISFELEPPSAEVMAGRIAAILERGPYIVAEVDGAVRAYAYAGRFRERAAYDWSCESTVYVDRTLHRSGLGRATMEAVLRVLRLQGFRLVIAGVTPPNPGSVGLHRALGFERVGTFENVGWKQGRWWGVEFFELALGSGDGGAGSGGTDGAEPVPVRPLPDLLGTPELARAISGA